MSRIIFRRRNTLAPTRPASKSRCKSALLGAALLELFDSLLLILDLYRGAVVETLEFPREAHQRLVRELHIGFELLQQRLGRRRYPLAHTSCRRRHFTQTVACGRQFGPQRFAHCGDFAADLRLPLGAGAGKILAEALARSLRLGLELAMQFIAARGEVLAKLDSRGAERLAHPHHLGAQVGARRGDALAILRDPVRDEADLTPDLRKLAHHFLAQRVESAPKSRHRFEHEVKARSELLKIAPTLFTASSATSIP